MCTLSNIIGGVIISEYNKIWPSPLALQKIEIGIYVLYVLQKRWQV